MARGWESKDIESQLAQAEADRRAAKAKSEADTVRGSLELNRIRLLREIAETPHERHKAQLRSALAHIESQLKPGPPRA